MFAVVEGLAWPNSAAAETISTPFRIMVEAAVWTNAGLSGQLLLGDAERLKSLVKDCFWGGTFAIGTGAGFA